MQCRRWLCRGSGEHVHKESARNTGRPLVGDDQPDADDGQAERPGVAERRV